MGDDSISLQKMQVAGWIYLVMLTAGSWLLVSWSFAWAVLAGGVISMLSFSLSHHDVVGYFESLSSVPAEEQKSKEKVKKSKTGFLLRFWFRIGVIGIVLLLLIKSGKANVFGLILGLSTVVFTITFSALRAAGHYLFSGRR
ncbi:MAG TPA: ATP synthase subunit I [Desulfopila sp.]|nr:ATP synthase subunit I [Desulfopila sp.]